MKTFFTFSFARYLIFFRFFFSLLSENHCSLKHLFSSLVVFTSDTITTNIISLIVSFNINGWRYTFLSAHTIFIIFYFSCKFFSIHLNEWNQIFFFFFIYLFPSKKKTRKMCVNVISFVFFSSLILFIWTRTIFRQVKSISKLHLCIK